MKPKLVYKWGYDHIGGWPVHDELWTQTLQHLSPWTRAMMRLLTSARGDDTYSRSPSSWISLDTASVGIAHWWAKRIPHLVKVCYGLDWSLPTKRGRVRFKPEQQEYLDTWLTVTGTEQGHIKQVNYWLQDTIPKAMRIIDDFNLSEHLYGVDGGRIVAAVARMVNSSPKRARRCLKKGWKRRRSVKDNLERVLSTHYRHPERFKRIYADSDFLSPLDRETYLINLIR